MLKLSDIRKPLKIDVQSPCVITRLGRIENRYDIDWDIILSDGKPLQRDFCWSHEQKSELILSVLKNIPIPPFSFIIGGKQRLSTLIDFYKGVISFHYEGKNYFYKDLDKSAQFEFEYFDIMASVAYEPFVEDTQLRKTEKCVPFNDEDIIEWFKLINFAGTPQNKEHLNYLNSIIKNS